MPDLQPDVVVRDLYKSFNLPHEQGGGLKQMLLNIFRSTSKRQRSYEVQNVLEDISFEIKKGEFFGIVGRNGSGKSTLLKLLAGIYVPDKGLVQVNGSLTPFIELGVGFNPELTGRENVYMNGALLGFSHKDMDGMYDDIVDFAELPRFMDQKLKNYSSGMQVRLAFSIAIRAQSDILLIDEVLAVGDSAFQKKCFDYFEEIKKQNKTIILVTHDMSAVEKFCDRCLLIDKGYIKSIGDPYEIASQYAMLNQKSIDEQEEKQSGIKLLGGATIDDVKIEFSQQLDKDKDLTLSVKINGNSTVDDILVGVSIVRRDNVYISGENNRLEPFKITKGSFTVDYKLDLKSLLKGSYFVNISLYTRDFKLLDFKASVGEFTIKDSAKNKDGIIDLPGDWKYHERG